MEKEPTQQFSIRMPVSLLERLEKLAKRNYRTRTQEIIRLVEEELGREEKNPKETP